MGLQESAIYQVLRRAQSDGSLDRDQDTRALARFFVGVAQGLNVVNKAMFDPAILKDMVKVAMRVWDARSGSMSRNAPRKIKARTTKPRRVKSKRTGSQARLFDS